MVLILEEKVKMLEKSATVVLDKCLILSSLVNIPTNDLQDRRKGERGMRNDGRDSDCGAKRIRVVS